MLYPVHIEYSEPEKNPKLIKYIKVIHATSGELIMIVHLHPSIQQPPPLFIIGPKVGIVEGAPCVKLNRHLHLCNLLHAR